MNDDAARNYSTTRRIFLKRMAYVPPTILTMSAVASVASAASGGPILQGPPAKEPGPGGNRSW